MYQGESCTAGAKDPYEYPLAINPGECFAFHDESDDAREMDFTSAFAKVSIPKGVNCSISLFWPSARCYANDKIHTGAVNVCVDTPGPRKRSGSARYDCKTIPLPKEWPPADVTLYSSQNCGQGVKQQRYPNIKANICTTGDISVYFPQETRIRSGVAQLVADTQIPIPPGTGCKLVLFQGTDCRATSVPTEGRGDPGVCVKPFGTHLFPIKAFMWQCGYA